MVAFIDSGELLKALLKKPTEELLTPERVREYIEQGVKFKHYIGFEISGFVHLGTGLVTMSKVADLQKVGVKTTIFLADWHSWLNKKLGGDLGVIRKIAGGYFKEALLKSLEVVGGDPEKVDIVLGSKLYEKLGLDYWSIVTKISLNTTLSRIMKGTTIAGRRARESMPFAQLLYVPMQVADIFGLEATIAHGGMDQRKAHVLAIEVGEKIGYWKPIALHHHLLMGLSITEEDRRVLLEAKRTGNRELLEEKILDIKMSKSKPNTCIFIHDSEYEIKQKIRKAYCPFKETELNPIWDIVEWIIFREEFTEFEIVNEKTGERMMYTNLEQLKNDWISGRIHPLDLKNSVANWLIEKLEPVRKYFLEGKGAKYIEEMKEIQITR